MGHQIHKLNGTLHVPDTPVIPYIEGDGIGKDIWHSARKVIDGAVRRSYGGQRRIEWLEVLAGEEAYRKTGKWLPGDTIEAIHRFMVAIKGPLTTPVGQGIRSLNVALRRTFDLYVCLRPVRYFSGIESPLKHPNRVDMHIFRENTEDLYAGIEFMAGDEQTERLKSFLFKDLQVPEIAFSETASFGIKPITRDGSERLVRCALTYAIEQGLPSVTIVHKGNIMKFTEGAFRNWGYDLAERVFGGKTFTWRTYSALKQTAGSDAAENALRKAINQGKVIVKDVIMDAFLQETILTPEAHSVIATTNLNGDYISDQLAAMVGGIGLSPGGNINFDTGYALFEATHGTAPTIAGTGRANPASLILSGAMMLDYLGWDDAAHRIVTAMEETIAAGILTSDLCDRSDGNHSCTTDEFGSAVERNLDSLK